MPEIIQSYLELNIALAPLISIVLRITSIILAPIPGTPIDLLNIAFFGKNIGFIYTEISIIIGSTVNFWIARRFGESAVRKFVPIDKIHIWEERISQKSGFWGLVLIRMFSIPIFDYLSYIAGLTRMSFWKFFFSSIFASIPPTWAFYYLGDTFFRKGLLWSAIVVGILTLLYFLFQQGKIFKGFSEYIRIRKGFSKINELVNGREEK